MGAIIYTNGNFQAVDDDGNYVANGTLIFNNYKDGTPATTYKDSMATISNPYEIPLSASGKADVYLKGGEYEVILKDANGTVVRTIPRFIPFLGNNGGAAYAIREEFVATQSQTDFSLNDKPVGTTSVYVNGKLLDGASYTISFSVLTISSPSLNAGDIVIVDYNTIDSGSGGGAVTQTIISERNTVIDYNAISLSSGAFIRINGGKRITQASGFDDNGNVDLVEVLQSEDIDVSSLGASVGTNYLYRKINANYSVSSTKDNELDPVTMIGTKVYLGSFDYDGSLVSNVVPAVPTLSARDIRALNVYANDVNANDVNVSTLNGRDANIVLTGRLDGDTLYISSNSTDP